MSFLQRMDDWMFDDPPDRITLSEDDRAYVRLPARGILSISQTLWLISTCSWTNILMPFTLVALILDPISLSISTAFWLNFLALLPVIGLFRYSSEVLSVEAPAFVKLIWDFTLGPFSPDVEVAFIAVFYGHYDLTKIYMLRNTLRVILKTLGLCITVSGVRRSSDTWNTSAAYTSQALLTTAVAPYAIINACAKSVFIGRPLYVLVVISRAACLVLLVLYGLYQLFRRTHSSRFRREIRAGSSLRTLRKIGSSAAMVLLLSTILMTSICAAPIIKAVTIDRALLTINEPFGIPSQNFFGFCLLPVLAELAELTKICSLSYRGEMDISFEVAATTSIHMMLLVAPLLCLFAWYMGEAANLDLGGITGLVLFLNIWLFSITTRSGSSHWIQGVLVYGLYVVEALTFYLLPEDASHSV